MAARNRLPSASGTDLSGTPAEAGSYLIARPAAGNDVLSGSIVLLQRLPDQADEIGLTVYAGFFKNPLEVLAGTVFLQAQRERGLLDGAAIEECQRQSVSRAVATCGGSNSDTSPRSTRVRRIEKARLR